MQERGCEGERGPRAMEEEGEEEGEEERGERREEERRAEGVRLNGKD